MNIALGALLLFLLLFPGILVRISYLTGPHSRKNIQTSLVDELVLSLVPAFILQGIGYLIAERWFHYNIWLEQFYKLIIGANNKDYKPDFELIEKSLPHFFAYNVVLLVVAITVGNLARKLVEQFNLDISIYSLRYNNDWYYLLSGRILNFPQWETAANQVESVYADVLVETKEGSVLYCGLLDEFYLSKDGLDRICLSEVYRRKFTEDVKDDQRPEDKLFDNRYYRMPGDLFVIPYSQIRNLNLTYYGPVQVDEISAEAA
jgi:hypothetical protein